MNNDTLTKMANGEATIGDIAEFFQSVINNNQFWLLPQANKEMVFELDRRGICSINENIKPKQARKRAEEYVAKEREEKAKAKALAKERAEIERKAKEKEDKRRRRRDRARKTFSLGVNGRVAPPLSIRRLFK